MSESVESAVLTAESGDLLANQLTQGDQGWARTATLSNGNYVVTWSDGGTAISYRIFQQDGTPVTAELQANSTLSGAHSGPSISALADGRFVIAWDNTYGSQTEQITLANGETLDVTYPAESEVLSQVFNSDGTLSGSETRVNVATQGLQGYADVAGLADGGYVVSWLSFNGYAPFDTLDGSLYGRIFEPDGTSPLGSFKLNNLTYGIGLDSEIGAFSDGGFVAVWDGADWIDNEQSRRGLTAQLFNPDGTKEGLTFQINATATYQVSNVRVEILPDDKFVVVWNEVSDELGANQKFDIKARVFERDGTTVGPEFAIVENAGTQRNPDVTVVGADTFLVTWTDESGLAGAVPFGSADPSTSVKAQVVQIGFVPDSSEVGTNVFTISKSDVFQINEIVAEAQSDPSVTSLGDGKYAFSWIDNSQSPDDPFGTAVRTKIVDLNLGPEVVGTTVLRDQFERFGDVSVNFAEGNFVDPEGRPMTFRLVEPGTDTDVILPEWLSFDPSTGEVSGTHPGGAPYTLTADVVATDDRGLSARLFGTATLTPAGLSTIGSADEDAFIHGTPQRHQIDNGKFMLVYAGDPFFNTFFNEWVQAFTLERFSADGLLTDRSLLSVRSDYESIDLTPYSENEYVFTTVVTTATGKEFLFDQIDGARNGSWSLTDFHGGTNITNGDFAVSGLIDGRFQFLSASVSGASTDPNDNTATETFLGQTSRYWTFEGQRLSDTYIDFRRESQAGGFRFDPFNIDVGSATDSSGHTLYVFATDVYGTSSNARFDFKYYDANTSQWFAGDLPYYADPADEVEVYATDLGYFLVRIGGAIYDFDKSAKTFTAHSGYEGDYLLNSGYWVTIDPFDHWLTVTRAADNTRVGSYNLGALAAEVIFPDGSSAPAALPEITDLGDGRFRISSLNADGLVVYRDFSIDDAYPEIALGDLANTFLSDGTGPKVVLGQGGDDTLTGSAFADALIGGDGNDSLTSGGGADKLVGGRNNDVLVLRLSGGTFGALEGELNGAQFIGGPGLDTLVIGSGGYVDLSKALVREIEVLDMSLATAQPMTVVLSGADLAALSGQPGGLQVVGANGTGSIRALNVEL